MRGGVTSFAAEEGFSGGSTIQTNIAHDDVVLYERKSVRER